MTEAITRGVHHIGLTVSRLEESAAFFTTVLGWREVRRDNAPPSIFVSDGTVLVTLWQAREGPAPFDRVRNVGLHHVAFAVRSESDLDRVHRRLIQHHVPIEFPPEPMRGGPARHMICYEPSGIRVEFTWAGA